LTLIDFKDAQIHKGTNAFFQWVWSLNFIKNDKNIQLKENLSKINRPLDDTMQGFQWNQCLKFIDFKNAKIHKEKNAYFQCKKDIKNLNIIS
jgi:hypothetical protein